MVSEKSEICPTCGGKKYYKSFQCRQCANWARIFNSQEEFVAHIKKIYKHLHRNDNHGNQANDSQHKTNGASRSSVEHIRPAQSQVIAEIGRLVDPLTYFH
jgi:predicted ATP-dependent serine protease